MSENDSNYGSTRSPQASGALIPKQRWPTGILELPATPEEIDEFIQWKMDQYEQHNFTGSDLSQFYGEDFQNFELDTFRAADPALTRKLRIFLRKYGVYVNSLRGHYIPETLMAAIKEELPWPENDKENPERQSRRTMSPAPIVQPLSPIVLSTPVLAQPQPRTQSRYTPNLSVSPIRIPAALTPLQIPQIQQPTPATGYTTRVQPAVTFEPIRQETSHAQSKSPMLGQAYTQPQVHTQSRIPAPVQSQAPTPGRQEMPPYELDIPDYSRQIANLSKIYADEDRYSGQSDDSFDFKFSIFVSNCVRSGIPMSAQGLAFPTMLTGLAKDYYYKSCQGLHTVEQLCDAIHKRFETEEQGRLNLLNWDTLTLDSTIKKNPEKSTAQCLDILIKQMTTTQRNLPVAYHSDYILRDKLINACRTNKACKHAC
jgi:hypothetical protein